MRIGIGIGAGNGMAKSNKLSLLLTSTGNGTGVSTLTMAVSSSVTITLGANASFYTDAGGTLGQTQSWTITSGANRVIYLKCTTGTATFTIDKRKLITKWGSQSGSVDGWTSGTNAAQISGDFSKLSNLTELRITGNFSSTYALPSTLLYLYMNGTPINWTYTGSVPSGLTYLNLNGANIAWSYSGSLPPALTLLALAGSSINWTGLDMSGTGTFGTFSLGNFRIAKITSADLITLLTSMQNRVGGFGSTVTINDYVDYASPPGGVTTAVNALKAAKSITTVNLGA
jgi:hypothetical protein